MPYSRTTHCFWQPASYQSVHSGPSGIHKWILLCLSRKKITFRISFAVARNFSYLRFCLRRLRSLTVKRSISFPSMANGGKKNFILQILDIYFGRSVNTAYTVLWSGARTSGESDLEDIDAQIINLKILKFWKYWIYCTLTGARLSGKSDL
jgi:hypothetical protein